MYIILDILLSLTKFITLRGIAMVFVALFALSLFLQFGLVVVAFGVGIIPTLNELDVSFISFITSGEEYQLNKDEINKLSEMRMEQFMNRVTSKLSTN